jgi:exopolysaccharide production protein ExoY
LATQQLSKASEASLPKAAAGLPQFRPRLVSVEAQRDPAAFDDGNPFFSGREALQILGISGVSVLDQDVPLVAVPDESTTPRRRRSVRETLKRMVDIAGAIVLGVVFLPLMLLIVLLLRNEGGPLIYRHRRVGQDGKTFECLKFRSMVPDADRKLREVLEQCPELKAEWLRDHKLRNDPRITAVGRFLRRTSFDELPQIWNVLRGDMSLVGPRPIVREEMMRYGRCLPVYLSTKPGITGLWQVTGRNDTNYRRRVVLDVYYVRKRSALLDLYILLKTARVILGGGGAY